MRLVNLVPFISAELVALLEDIGIRIESDLLFSVTLLEIFSRLPTGITSLENSNRSSSSSSRSSVLLQRVGFGIIWCRSSGSSTRRGALQRQRRYESLLRDLGSPKFIQISRDRGPWDICTISEMRQSGPRVLPPNLRWLDPCLNLVLNHLAAREGSTAAWIDYYWRFLC